MIDLLRFFAASWVALFHFNSYVPFRSNWYRIIVHEGKLGVPLFFVISGYCINYATNHADGPWTFFVKRIFRIYPTYWFSIMVVLFSLFCYRLYYGGNPVHLPKTLSAILATISLFTDPLAKVTPVNIVYWTLTYEIFFYLTIFIVLFFPKKHHVYWLIIITASVLILPLHNYWLLFFLQYWPSFCLGVVTYKLLHDHKSQLFAKSVLLLLCLIALSFKSVELKYTITCIISALLIMYNHYKPIRENVLSRFGDYSYSIYLLHVPVGITVLGFVKQLQIVQTNIYLNIFWDISLFIFIIWLSKLSFVYIELRGIKCGKRFINKYLGSHSK